MFRDLLRRRYGLATRKVGVRSEFTWQWYLLLGLIALLVWLSIGGWMFDAGRRIAGFDSAETSREIADLKAQVLALEGRLKLAQEQARSGDTKLHVEAAAVGELTGTLRALQRENASLKEDLAIFEGLVTGYSSAPGGPVRVLRAAIQRAGDARYTFRMMLVNQHAQRHSRDFIGSLRFDLQIRNGSGTAMISVPSGAEAGEKAYPLHVKHIQRVEGEFVVPAGAEVLSGEIAVMQEGRVVHRHPFSM